MLGKLIHISEFRAVCDPFSLLETLLENNEVIIENDGQVIAVVRPLPLDPRVSLIEKLELLKVNT
jgi:hypothetical protein